MTEWRNVAGSSLFEQAVRVAGALAEAGVAEVILRVGAKEFRLRAREADLPGAIAGAAPGSELLIPSHSIRLRTTGKSLQWIAADPLRAGEIAAALGSD